MLYPASVPFDKISLMVSALRGGEVPTAVAVKAAWELSGYGFGVTLGDPDGPQAMTAAVVEMDDLPLSDADAVKQLETALASAGEARELPNDPSLAQASVLPFIGKQLALYLLQWIVLQLGK